MLIIYGEVKHGKSIYVPMLSPERPPRFTPLVKRRFHPYLRQEVPLRCILLTKTFLLVLNLEVLETM